MDKMEDILREIIVVWVNTKIEEVKMKRQNKSYTKVCACGTKIVMTPKNNSWLPIDPKTDAIHKCEAYVKPVKVDTPMSAVINLSEIKKTTEADSDRLFTLETTIARQRLEIDSLKSDTFGLRQSISELVRLFEALNTAVSKLEQQEETV